MAGTKTPRLKVFVTRIGVSDWAVAVTSQKAALAAWDVRENLFASGAAEETHEPAAITAAMKNPGVPVAFRRQTKIPVGSNVVRLPTRPKNETPTPVTPKKDRTRLDEAEAALVLHRRDAKRQRADMERRRRLLEDELAGEEADIARKEKMLEAKVEKARKAYEDG